MTRNTSLNSNRKLGQRAGLSDSTIWRILQGDNSAKLENIEKLARAFRVHPLELLADHAANQDIVAYSPVSQEAIEIAEAWENLPESDKIEIKAYLSIKTAMTFGVGKPVETTKKPK